MNGGKIYFGGTDDSRQNNKLIMKQLILHLLVMFKWIIVLLTFGYENTEKTTVFNMFMQESIGGEWDFKFSDDGDNLEDQGNVALDFQNTATLVPERCF